MKTKRNLVNLTLVGSLALTLCLSGCGNRLPAAAPEVDEPAAEEPVAPVTDPVDPVTQPSTPTYEQPAAPPVIAGSLVVNGVNKAKKGFIGFRKVEVTGTVMNTSSVPLSGTLKLEFKEKKGIINKRLETVETKTQIISNLAPGSSLPFTIKSDKSCDDVEVTVETDQPVTAAGMGGYGQPAANPYGNPYGQSTGNPYGQPAGNPYGQTSGIPGQNPYGY